MYLSNKLHISNTPKSAKQFVEQKKEGDDIILVTSTEKISRMWNNELMRTSKRAFHSTDIYSFRNFVNEYYFKTFGKEIVDEIIENELIILAMENNNDFEVDYNYTTQIASILRGIREDGIRAKDLQEDLLDIIEKGEIDVTKVSNLFNIMRNYEVLLSKLDYVDYPLAMERLTEELDNTDVINNKKILFENFTSFRNPDINLIEKLSKAGNIIIVSTNTQEKLGPYLGENNFFLNELSSIGFHLLDGENQKIDIDIFRKDLGSDGSTSLLVKEHNKNINIHSLINIREEVYAVTKLVKYLLIAKKYLPSEICVVSRDVSAYSTLLREFFIDNDIPTNVTDRFQMSKSPIAISIIDILETVINDYNMENLTKVLASGYVETSISKPKRLIYLSKKYRLIGGTPEKEIAMFLTQITSRMNLLNKQNDDYRYDSDIKYLNEAKDSFVELEKRFGGIDRLKKYSAKEFVLLIKRIVNNFEIEKKILSLDEEINSELIDYNEKIYLSERIEKDGRALYKIFEILNKLRRLLEATDGITEYNLSYLVHKFKGIISISRYQIREKKKYGVDVTSIEQTRGLKYKIKIMAGAVEGMMPIGFSTDRLVGKILQESESRHYFEEYIQFHEFFNDKNIDEYFIFSHREDNSEMKIDSHFITPLLDKENVNIYKDYSDLDWQNTIINKRELIFSNLNRDKNNSDSEELKKLFDTYYENKELQINLSLDEEEIQSRISEYCFSVSELNSFLNYPYDYFYFKLLNMNKYEDVGIFLTDRELGNIIHNSIELTFNLYKLKNSSCIKKTIKGTNIIDLDLIKLENNDKSSIVDLFKVVVEEKIETYGVNQQFLKLDKLYLIGDDNNEGILIKWFDKIIERHINSNYFIGGYEYKFRCTKSKSFNNNILFSGKIDRIDISEDLTKFRIIDYKLKASSKDSIQLSIYSAVMSYLFEHNYNLRLNLDDLVYDSFKYGSDDKDKNEYKSFKKDKRKLLSDVVVSDMDKAQNIVRNLITLDFDESLRNHSQAFESNELTLLRRD